MPAIGGTPIRIADVTGPRMGLHWGTDDRLLIGGFQDGLKVVPATGGIPAVLTTRGEGERGQHVTPSLLPDGKTILYTAGAGLNFANASIVVQSLETGERKTLWVGGAFPSYSPTGR